MDWGIHHVPMGLGCFCCGGTFEGEWTGVYHVPMRTRLLLLWGKPLRGMDWGIHHVPMRTWGNGPAYTMYP